MSKVNFTQIILSQDSRAKYAAAVKTVMRQLPINTPADAIIVVRFLTLIMVAPDQAGQLLIEMVKPLWGDTWLNASDLANEIQLGQVTPTVMESESFQSKVNRVMDAVFKELALHHGCGESDIAEAFAAALA